MMHLSRGSGSKIDKKDYKSKPFTYVHNGKNQTDEVPAFGLLLQSSDATSWKEGVISFLKRHAATGILDTYPADANQLSTEFRKKLASESTPKKAQQAEEVAAPVSQAVPLQQLHRFTSTDLKMVAEKTVFITRDGYLESDEIAQIREGASTYLRMSAQGGIFEHVWTKLQVKNDVALHFQLLLKEATVTNDMALFNAHLNFAAITMKDRNLSDLYTRMSDQAKVIKDLAEMQEPPSSWLIHPKQMLCQLVKETMMADVYYRAMAESGGIVEKLCTGNSLTPLEFVTVITEKEKFYEQINPKGTLKNDSRGTPNAHFASPDKTSTRSNDTMCRNWAARGACRFGDSCVFQHAVNPGAGGPSSDLNKTTNHEKSAPTQQSQPLQCSNCDKEGHVSKACTSPKVVCAFCNKRGHLKKFCHSMKEEIKKKAAEMIAKADGAKPIEGKSGGAESNFATTQAHANWTAVEYDDSIEDAKLWEVSSKPNIGNFDCTFRGAAHVAECKFEDLNQSCTSKYLNNGASNSYSTQEQCAVTPSHQSERAVSAPTATTSKPSIVARQAKGIAKASQASATGENSSKSGPCDPVESRPTYPIPESCISRRIETNGHSTMQPSTNIENENQSFVRFDRQGTHQGRKLDSRTPKDQKNSPASDFSEQQGSTRFFPADGREVGSPGLSSKNIAQHSPRSSSMRTRVTASIIGEYSLQESDSDAPLPPPPQLPRIPVPPSSDNPHFYPHRIGDFELYYESDFELGPEGRLPKGYAREDKNGYIVEIQPNAEACRRSILKRQARQQEAVEVNTHPTGYTPTHSLSSHLAIETTKRVSDKEEPGVALFPPEALDIRPLKSLDEDHGLLRPATESSKEVSDKEEPGVVIPLPEALTIRPLENLSEDPGLLSPARRQDVAYWRGQLPTLPLRGIVRHEDLPPVSGGSWKKNVASASTSAHRQHERAQDRNGADVMSDGPSEGPSSPDSVDPFRPQEVLDLTIPAADTDFPEPDLDSRTTDGVTYTFPSSLFPAWPQHAKDKFFEKLDQEVQTLRENKLYDTSDSYDSDLNDEGDLQDIMCHSCNNSGIINNSGYCSCVYGRIESGAYLKDGSDSEEDLTAQIQGDAAPSTSGEVAPPPPPPPPPPYVPDFILLERMPETPTPGQRFRWVQRRLRLLRIMRKEHSTPPRTIEGVTNSSGEAINPEISQ